MNTKSARLIAIDLTVEAIKVVVTTKNRPALLLAFRKHCGANFCRNFAALGKLNQMKI